MRPLRIGINAQLTPGGSSGGAEQLLLGLIYGLGRLTDGPEEYVVIHSWQEPDWLQPFVGANQQLVAGSKPQSEHTIYILKRMLGPLAAPVRSIWRQTQPRIHALRKSGKPTVRVSDGFYESLAVDVMHFPYPAYVKVAMPTVFNPLDLQHLHFREFFPAQEFTRRETVYRAGCELASAVAVCSEWVKRDITRQYGTEPCKIQAIHAGSPTSLYAPLTPHTLLEVRQKYQLPEEFALYPAQTWPHKNHIRLLEAMQLLREEQGLSLHLVCTGQRNDFWPTVRRRMHELQVEQQVHFLDFVEGDQLRALYHLAQFLVFPSLFEGAGLPVLEGMQEGTPVACSAVTSLPEYGGDAVLQYEPTSVAAIADALFRMATDAELRATLRRRGTARVASFTWEKMARTHRALYRKVAKRKLSEEDIHLLTRKHGAGHPYRETEYIDAQSCSE